METEKSIFGKKLEEQKWLTFAKTIIARDEHFCQCCGNQGDLEVHFLRYTAADPWNEPSYHLTTLCVRCHAFEHATRHAVEKLLLDSLDRAKFVSIDLLEVLSHIMLTFQSRGERISNDRLRRLRIRSDEILRDPEIAEYSGEVPKLVDRIFSRIDDRDFQVSEEFFDIQSQILGMHQERRKRADDLVSAKGALIPPDSTTYALFSRSGAESTQIGDN